MKNIVVLLTTMILSFIVLTATADMKVGVINLQEILQKTPQMKQVSADLKKQFNDRESKLVAGQTALKKAVEDYKKNAAVMSENDRKAAEQKLIAQQQDLQKMQMSFQQEFVTAQNKHVNILLERIRAIVAQVATQLKLNLVLTNASVAYADKEMDITPQVMAQLLKS